MPALHVRSTANRLDHLDILPRLRRLGQATAFWTAIVLLAAYPPALLLPDSGAPELVTAVLAIHAVFLLLGHGYDPS